MFVFVLWFKGSLTETRTKEKAEKIRKEFEIKLSKMSAEKDRLQKASKEHTKLIKSKSQHERQMKTLQSDLADMKKLKVCVCMGKGKRRREYAR